jgi:hypothetical protein
MMNNQQIEIRADEREKIIANYFTERGKGRLKSLPKKLKKKIIILEHILTKISANTIYSEAELNAVLKNSYEDFVTLRRDLIEFNYMNRSKDCSQYWINSK